MFLVCCCSGNFGCGVCIFSKYLILETFHYRYTLNGYAHRIFHGDWFCGKSICLAKVQVGDLRGHIYGTHVSISSVIDSYAFQDAFLCVQSSDNFQMLFSY